MAPPLKTSPSSTFEDLVGVVEPITGPKPDTVSVRLENPMYDAPKPIKTIRPLSERLRSGEDRRERPRRSERRNASAAPSGSATESLTETLTGLVGQDLRSEVAMWFEDLRWGTPLARRLIGVGLSFCFVAFCVSVLILTFADQAVL